MKCIVSDCQNTTDEGTFVGPMCTPCYNLVVGGEVPPTGHTKIWRAVNAHDRLVAALEKYGVHGLDEDGEGCAGYLGENYPCICGFRTALALARGEVE